MPFRLRQTDQQLQQGLIPHGIVRQRVGDHLAGVDIAQDVDLEPAPVLRARFPLPPAPEARGGQIEPRRVYPHTADPAALIRAYLQGQHPFPGRRPFRDARPPLLEAGIGRRLHTQEGQEAAAHARNETEAAGRDLHHLHHPDYQRVREVVGSADLPPVHLLQIVLEQGHPAAEAEEEHGVLDGGVVVAACLLRGGSARRLLLHRGPLVQCPRYLEVPGGVPSAVAFFKSVPLLLSCHLNHFPDGRPFLSAKTFRGRYPFYEPVL